ncbi:MAG: serine/threonine protein kinase [Clostridia bacterium]|nr:serine/threonine protein kinase [Clostridia bacterium]
MTLEEYTARLREAYDLVCVLSRKNGCEVFRLRHRELGRDLVLRRFSAPVPAYDILCAVRCENLPLIYDAVSCEDGMAVLEEYIDGLTVTQVMESGRYRPAGARQVMSGVCRALQVLHERGLVHRDVKPDNVMIARGGRVVLIDLNASRKVSDATRDTVILGTVGYASPEQMGIAQSDARTDIYAAGVLLNVMVTGRHPSEVMAKGRIGRIVRKCTSVNPADRYASAGKLEEALGW